MSILAGVTARGVLYLSLPPWFPPWRGRSPYQAARRAEHSILRPLTHGSVGALS
nr:MAG TPA: hypothetical protein [Bacteriophage sp.]